MLHRHRKIDIGMIWHTETPHFLKLHAKYKCRGCHVCPTHVRHIWHDTTPHLKRPSYLPFCDSESTVFFCVHDFLSWAIIKAFSLVLHRSQSTSMSLSFAQHKFYWIHSAELLANFCRFWILYRAIYQRTRPISQSCTRKDRRAWIRIAFL